MNGLTNDNLREVAMKETMAWFEGIVRDPDLQPTTLKKIIEKIDRERIPFSHVLHATREVGNAWEYSKSPAQFFVLRMNRLLREHSSATASPRNAEFGGDPNVEIFTISMLEIFVNFLLGNVNEKSPAAEQAVKLLLTYPQHFTIRYLLKIFYYMDDFSTLESPDAYLFKCIRGFLKEWGIDS